MKCPAPLLWERHDDRRTDSLVYRQPLSGVAGHCDAGGLGRLVSAENAA